MKESTITTTTAAAAAATHALLTSPPASFATHPLYPLQVQEQCIKALAFVLDKKDNRAVLSEQDSLLALLEALRAHETCAMLCYRGLVLLSDLAAGLSVGDLRDLAKRGGCAFAVKQLVHQVRQGKGGLGGREGRYTCTYAPVCRFTVVPPLQRGGTGGVMASGPSTHSLSRLLAN